MQVSNHGAEFTAHWENVYQNVYCPYWDVYGRVYTRGYGETDFHGNFNGRCISHYEAVNNLRSLLDNNYGRALNEFINKYNIPLDQNQFDSMTDILYNLGTGALDWDMGRSLREKNYLQCANQMLEYRFAGGVELPGLRERRYGDHALFLSGTQYPNNPPPIVRENPLNVLLKPEKDAVNAWIKYNKHPKLHVGGLRTIYGRMVAQRKAIYNAAVHGKVGQKRVPMGWNTRHRYKRYQLMKKYTAHPPK